MSFSVGGNRHEFAFLFTAQVQSVGGVLPVMPFPAEKYGYAHRPDFSARVEQVVV